MLYRYCSISITHYDICKFKNILKDSCTFGLYILFSCARQTPVIAVLGSGGGYRALIAFVGVLKALEDSKMLDCATYLSSLSGSSWWVSMQTAELEYTTKRMTF